MARTLENRKRRGSAKVIANGTAGATATLLVREGIPDSNMSAEPPRPRRTLQGCIEEASRTLIKGWVWDPETPGHPIRLELTEGEASVATAIANDKRPGLSLAGIGDGTHGFTIKLEEGLLAEDRHLSPFVAPALRRYGRGRAGITDRLISQTDTANRTNDRRTHTLGGGQRCT
jgi:hypothetical protein